MMNNKYDQILREKLQEVNSTPPIGLWSKIEASIPTAESTAAFDQAVKGKLAEVASNPPVGLWSKIENAIQGYSPFYKTPVFRWSAAAVLLVSAFLGWNTLSNQHDIDTNPIVQKSPVESTINQQPVNPDKNSTKNNTKARETTEKAKKNLTPSNFQKASEVNSKANPKAKVETKVIHVVSKSSQKITTPSTSKSILVKQVITSSEEINNKEQHKIEIIEPFAPIKIEPMESVEIAVKGNNVSTDSLDKELAQLKIEEKEKQENTSNPEVVINEITNENQETNNAEENKIGNKVKPSTLPRNPRSLNKYGVQISYNPSYINTSVNRVDKQDISISLAFQNMNFIADLGLGIGFSSEKNNFIIDYKHYEFVKTQFVTDSLTYNYDPNTQTYTPVAVGHQEKVYDDVKYSYSSEVTTNYTYLNIPFNMGYVKELKYFDLFAKGGINYSMIISKTEKGMFVPDEFTTIINKDYSSKTRINTNVSYRLAFGAAIKFNNDLKFTGEVTGGYYQNHFYSDVDFRPYSYGVRFGLIYYLR